MFKRATWFTIGAAVGAGGTVVGYLRARELARRHVPESVHDAAGRVADRAMLEVDLLADRAAAARDRVRSTSTEAVQARRAAERLLDGELRRSGL